MRGASGVLSVYAQTLPAHACCKACMPKPCPEPAAPLPARTGAAVDDGIVAVASGIGPHFQLAVVGGLDGVARGARDVDAGM